MKASIQGILLAVGVALAAPACVSKPYSNAKLQEWASDTVFVHNPLDDDVYKACEALAIASKHRYPSIKGGLDADYPPDLTNACAIVLFGAEF